MTKKCIKCGNKKNVSFFSKTKANKDGLAGLCKSCHLEYLRERRKKNPEKDRERKRRYYHKNKQRIKEMLDKNIDKIQAKRLARTAMEKGIITKKPCEKCGSHETLKHHDDYSKPIQVRWLCALCHARWHKKHGEGIRLKRRCMSNKKDKIDVCDNRGNCQPDDCLLCERFKPSKELTSRGKKPVELVTKAQKRWGI